MRLLRLLPAAVVLGGVALAAAPAEAQDTLYRIRGGTIEVEIDEITFNEVRYRLPGVGRIQKIARDQIAKWEFGEMPRAYESGQEAFGLGDFETAAVHFTKAAQSSAKQKWVKPFSMYFRAESLLRLGRIALAIDAFKQYLDEAPEDAYAPNAHIGIGRAYLYSDKLNEADRAFGQVTGGTYGDSFALKGEIWKAKVLEAKGQWDEAENAYKGLESKANLETTKLEAKLRRYLCAVQVAIKKKDDSKLSGARRSLKDVLKAAETDDIRAAAWNGIGETYYYLTTPDHLEALLAFLQVTLRFEQQTGEMAKALYHVSHSYMNQADVISPIPDMPEALKDRPARMFWSRLKGEYPNSAWARKSPPKRG